MINQKKTNKNWPGIILFLIPICLLYFTFFIYPICFVGYVSFMEWNGIKDMVFIGIDNYINLFTDENFLIGIRNNFIWALSQGFIQVGLALLIALILARKPRAWKFLRTTYFLPNVISQIAIAMMWMAIFNPEYGILNYFLNSLGLENWTHNWLGEIETALFSIIFHQVIYIGYFMIIILASAMSIPETLYEAAEIDGANTLQQEIHITLPLIRPMIITATTLAMAYGLRHFEATFLMTEGGPANSTNVMGIHLYQKWKALEFGQANATGTILIVLGALVIVLIQRIFGRNDSTAENTQ
ncbi:MAG: sugar ABC transporter permease [Spirochaetes bacterium]|nr:sugar ABC transporter permease [Spirochaetota bacterium]